jgi:hypothetical protein
MTTKRTHRNRTGKTPIDEEIERLVDEAEAGYDVDELVARRGRRGRPTLGSGPASVESVRIDPELRDELTSRADADGVSVSELIRTALREYLARSA